MTDKKIGNIGEDEYKECVKYFEYYWHYFIQRNPHCKGDEDLMQQYFMVFLSGFSAGINIGETKKTTLIEEIIKSN
jgi:hypothetical protein